MSEDKNEKYQLPLVPDKSGIPAENHQPAASH